MKLNKQGENIKIIFSIISLCLMFIPLVKGTDDYYRTLFIFLINEVIDLLFGLKNIKIRFFSIWAFLNQWLGVVACSIAFCLMVKDFYHICSKYIQNINLSLFTLTISFVLFDLSYLIFVSYKTNVVRKKINLLK